MAMAPFDSDDSHFYDAINRGDNTYQKYRDAVSEEQASHARAMGQIYGQMPLDALKGGMAGADWRQQREARNQEYQQRQADMARAEENQGFRRSQEGRESARFAHEQAAYPLEDQRRQMELDNMKAEEAFKNAPVTPEQAQKYSLQPGASRRDLGFAQDYQGRDLQFDTTRQQLANAKQNAALVAQQIGQNAQTFQNQQYTFESTKAANELDDIYSIRDPKVQTVALEEWRQRHGSRLLGGEQLSNMAQGAATRKQAQLAETDAQRAAATKLVYGSAIQEAQAMTQKLDATQKLAQAAKVYAANAHAGGAWENDIAKDARENAAMTLASLGNHHAAEKVRSGMFAGARDILGEQAQAQAQQTLMEFNDWYARQDNRVQQLPEVQRAYQQSQALQAELQGSNNPQPLRKLPSLVGSQATGANVQANRAFLGGLPQQQTQQPQNGSGWGLGTIPLPGYPAPQQPPMAPQPAGMMQSPDPYGLSKGGRYGSR